MAAAVVADQATAPMAEVVAVVGARPEPQQAAKVFTLGLLISAHHAKGMMVVMVLAATSAAEAAEPGVPGVPVLRA
jgi:hypothetical protein